MRGCANKKKKKNRGQREQQKRLEDSNRDGAKRQGTRTGKGQEEKGNAQRPGRRRRRSDDDFPCLLWGRACADWPGGAESALWSGDVMCL